MGSEAMEATVEVRYFEAAAAAAGCRKETLSLPAGATLGHLRSALVGRHGTELGRILDVAAFLLGAEFTRDLELPVGSRVDVLPPFAGG